MHECHELNELFFCLSQHIAIHSFQLEEAKQLVRDAIAGGVFNDLGSGSNVDLCIITKDGANMIRPYDVANVKGQR